MNDQRGLFYQMFHVGPFPDLSDEVIDGIEDFLLYSVDLELNNYIENILQFFIINLSSFLRDGMMISVENEHYKRRLLRALRFFRHHSLPPQLSYQLEQIAFQYLNNTIGFSQQQVYVFLVDHYVASSKTIPNQPQDLFQWSLNYIQRAAINLNEIDIQLLLTIIYSFLTLLAVQGSGYQNEILTSIDNLLRIAGNIITNKSVPDFFDSKEHIVSKCLRLVSRLIFKMRMISQNVIPFVMQIQKEIPDDVRFHHIYENNLLCISAIIAVVNDEQANIDDLMKFFMQEMIKSMYFFLHMPLVQNKRVSIYLGALSRCITRLIRKNPQNTPKIFIYIVMPLLSCFQSQIETIANTSKVIYDSFSPEVLRKSQQYTFFTFDVLEQLVASLETIKLDVESLDLTKQKPFEADLWLEANKRILKLIYAVLQPDSTSSQMNQMIPQDNGPFPPRINVFIRLVKYISYLLDIVGSIGNQSDDEFTFTSVLMHQIHVQDIRIKMSEIFETFIDILVSMNSQFLNHLLSLTLMELLPTKPYSAFHRSFFQNFTKKLVQPLPFYQIFFSTLTNHFDELLLPTPPAVLLNITRQIFQYAFVNQSPNQTITEIHSVLCQDLYRFLLLILDSRNPSLIELLLTMLQPVFTYQKEAALEPFRDLLRRNIFSMHTVLHSLADNPNSEIDAALLALFLFPFCDIKDEHVELWVQLFLPAIESDTHIVTSSPALYTFTHQTFPEWIKKLKPITQQRLISALSVHLPNMPAKDGNFPRSLLGKIPDVATRLSLLQITNEKNKTHHVIIDGIVISVDILFASMKRFKKPSDDEFTLLMNCYCQLLDNHNFFESVYDPLTCKIAEYIAKNKKDYLDICYQNLRGEQQYVALYFRQKYSTSIQTVLDQIEEPEMFIDLLSHLCFSKATTLPAIKIIEMLFDRITTKDLYFRVCIALIHSSHYEVEIATRIVEHKVFTTNFKTPEFSSLPMELSSQFSKSAAALYTNFRRLSIKLIKFFEVNYGVVAPMMKNRQNYLNELIKNLVKNVPIVCLEFLFTQPFTDVTDPTDLITNLVGYLKSETTINNVPIVSPEIQRLFKKLNGNDKALIMFSSIKFVFKVLARLLTTNRGKDSKLWENVFSTLRISCYHQFVPHFLKNLKHELNTKERIPQIQIDSSVNTLFPEDIMIYRFIAKYSPHQSTKQNIFVPISVCIRQISQTLLKNSKSTNERIISEIFKFAKVFKRFDSKADITPIIESIIQFLEFAQVNMQPLEPSFHHIVNTYPETVMSVVASMLKSKWSIDIFLISLDFLIHPKTPEFRHILFSLPNDVIESIIQFIRQKPATEVDFIVSRVFNAFAEIVNSLKPQQFNIIELYKTATKIFEGYVRPYMVQSNVPGGKTTEKHKQFRPSMFVYYLQVFLPIKYVDLFNNSVAWKICREVLLTICFKHTHLVQHPLWNRRLVDFLRFLDPPLREQFYSSFPDNSQLKIQQIIMKNQLLLDKYKNFPEPATLASGILMYNRTNDPGTNMFRDVVLHFTGAMLASNKNVVLTDLKESPLLTSNSYIHALAIHYKLQSMRTIRSLPRFFQIIKLLTTFDSQPLDLKEELSEKLNEMPYMLKASLLCFRTLGQQNCIIEHSSRPIIQFILGFTTTMLTTTVATLNTQFVYLIPHVFRHLIDIGCVHARVFEILLLTATNVLIRMSDNTAVAQLIPSTMEKYIYLIDFKDVNMGLVVELRRKLMLKTRNDVANQTRTKFLLQLIPVLAQLLFIPKANFIDNEFFFPAVLKPDNFFNVNWNKDVTMLYQKALSSSVNIGGFPVANHLVGEVYHLLKKSMNDISPPLPTPFASVSLWIAEVSSFDKPMQNLMILLDVLKPSTESQLFIELPNLKQPLHPYVIGFLSDLIPKEFSIMLGDVADFPTTRILTIKQSFDLLTDCWRMDWFELCQEYHLQVFIRMIMSVNFTKFLMHFTEKEMKNVVVTYLNTCRLEKGFERFFLYYLHHFPRSSLADCFSSTSFFKDKPPFPALPLFVNMSYLDQCNLPDDSLGLLKDTYPHFSTAASFHQISQYVPAKYFYLNEMSKHEETYFHGLLKLRNVVINLTLPITPDLHSTILTVQSESSTPEITLPFFQDSSSYFEFKSIMSQQNCSGNVFTSYLSQAYIPFFIRSSLFDEVYVSLKIMLQQKNLTNNIEEFIRVCNVNWIEAYDKQMMMASNLTWRMSILNDFLSSKETVSLNDETKNKIIETLNFNRSEISHLLASSGDLKASLKLLEMSDGNSQINVSQVNLGRIIQFIRNKPAATFLDLKLAAYSLTHNFKEPPATFDQWFKTVTTIFSTTPKTLDFRYCLKQVQNEMKNRRNDRNLNYYIAFIIALFRMDPTLSTELTNPQVDEIRFAWIKWIPQLIETAQNFSQDFQEMLVKTLPVLFYLHITTMTNSDESKNQTLNDIRMKLIEDRNVREYEQGMSWVKKCNEDIHRLYKSVQAHRVLYKYYSSAMNELPPDFPCPSVDELLRYCQENPPVFRTSHRISEYNSVQGFKFPFSTLNILHLSIEPANDLDESMLRMLTFRGESKTFQLVSPMIFQVSQREHMFFECASRLIESHQSAKTQSVYMNYPQSFLIHPALLLVNANFTNLHVVAQPYSIPQLYAEARSRVINDDNSPATMLIKKTIDLPDDLLFRWLVKGAGGSQTDFLFMRHSFVAHYSAYCFVHFIFGSPVSKHIPSVMLYKDRQKLCIPEFIQPSQRAIVYLPLSNQFAAIIPPFMMKGTFATTWQTMADSLAMHKEKLTIFMKALYKPTDEMVITKSLAQVSSRLDSISTLQMSEDTTKSVEVFPFKLIDFLIEKSNNVYKAQSLAFAWI